MSEVSFNATEGWIPNLIDIFEDGDGFSYLSFEQCDQLKELGAFNSTVYQALNFTLNMTTVRCYEHAPTLTKSATIRAGVLMTMALLSLLGNIATIFSINKSRQRRISRQSWSTVYTLIIHLSVADLFVTVFCIAGEAFYEKYFLRLAGNFACKLFKFLQMFSLYSSTFVLVLIGLDRFLAVRYPMKSLGTARRFNRLLLSAWIFSAILSLPQAIVFSVMKGPFLEDFHQCVTHGFYTEQWQEQLYTCLSLIFMFILPLMVLICTYVSTITTIAQSEKVFHTEVVSINKHHAPDLNRRRLIHRAKMKSLRISIVIVLAFVVCWTPYYTMMIIFMFMNPDKYVSNELQSAIFFFGMSNSLVNPIIYGAFQLWPRRRSRNSSTRNSGRQSFVTGSTRVHRMSQLSRGYSESEQPGINKDGKITNSEPKENRDSPPKYSVALLNGSSRVQGYNATDV